MGIKLANFIVTTLAEDITAIATAFDVSSTTGFPTLGVGDYFYMTLVRDSDGAEEIIKVTGWSTGEITACTRAQEGTSGLACVTGDTIKLAFTAATLTDSAAVPALTITVGTGALAKTLSFQSSVTGYYIIRAWLIDGSTPTDQQTLAPPSGSDIVQREFITNAAGLGTWDIAHVNAEDSWYCCAVIIGKVEISAVITMGT